MRPVPLPNKLSRVGQTFCKYLERESEKCQRRHRPAHNWIGGRPTPMPKCRHHQKHHTISDKTKTATMAGRGPAAGRRSARRQTHEEDDQEDGSDSNSSSRSHGGGEAGGSDSGTGGTNGSSGTNTNSNQTTTAEGGNVPTPMVSTHSGSSVAPSELSVAGWQPIVRVTDFRKPQTATRIKRYAQTLECKK